MCGGAICRKGPTPEVTQALFNHLVRAREKGRRDFDTERFRRLEINDKQVFGGLLDRKLGRFGAPQNSVDIVSPNSSQDRKVRPVGNQSARSRKVGIEGDRW